MYSLSGEIPMSGRSVLPLRALALLAVALVWSVPVARAADKPARADIDVVLCLDVSSSMNGLIDSAKVRLWDIVNDLGKIKPAPNLRVGLYSYGHNSYDRNKGWVRKEVDLSTDLDLVYQKLNGLTINGGTEYVTRVCRDAIVEQKWADGAKTLKLIFVCGNEPATQDKTLPLKTIAKMAIDKGIIINSIYCGMAYGGGKDWEEFAKMAEGRFSRINQNAGTIVTATPFDKKLAELSGKLNTTYLAYGKERERKARVQNQAAQDSNAAKLAPGVAATRAAAKAGGLYRNSAWDLVDRLKEDPKFDITKIPEKELCDELKKLKPEERVKHVKDMLKKRLTIQKEIAELNSKRIGYIQAEQKKNAKAGDRVFDEAVRGALREQAARKGISIPK
jgi:hypothetical protein